MKLENCFNFCFRDTSNRYGSPSHSLSLSTVDTAATTTTTTGSTSLNSACQTIQVIMTTPTPKIDCKKSALLLMDFQQAMVDRLPKPDELLTRVAAIASLARDRGVQIAQVRVAFDESDYAAIPDTCKMLIGVVSGRRLYHEAPEAAFHKQIAPQAGDIVVRKTRFGAFSTTDLDQQLRHRGIINLILAGFSTSGVVLSTVRDAADRDYRIYVLADGTADLDSEVHDMLIQKIFPRQAYVITTAELGALLSDA